ncbi:Putative tyrosine-protein kinase YveL [Lactobacillus plantarum] [Lactiplantibacillus mudanjiangensis]|uniref:tyrosine-protein kinase family protein n=1 Tax=Lactiplantibacillus mudanjiangensis TaxID=1296538 RepID=UPI001013DADB|nr:AAA family ATPase [Lactiplantibacillus mudanjiangensis]VDG32738.1 Putative tyrosine-protein kinase YveL [Lactobacillus plantarum] [Lactiplantibacillus mudanjiangensis]
MNAIKEAIRRINIGLEGESVTKVITFATPNNVMAQCTVIANLAIMYGQAKEKTIIVDTDFGHNSFSEAFKLNTQQGLADFLNNENMKNQSVIHEVPGQNVSIITPGSIEEGEAEFLIGDPKFKHLIMDLSKQYDHVFINSAQFTTKSQNSNLFGVSDGTIIVSELNKTAKKDIFRMIKFFKNEQIEILGYVNAKR